MGRLIDTDDLIENIAAIVDLRTLSTKTIGEAIAKTPTVDAVPVVHGHWIKFGVSDKDGNHQYRCSVCECEEIHSPLVKVSYCWNCGARMDGKEGDQND